MTKVEVSAPVGLQNKIMVIGNLKQQMRAAINRWLMAFRDWKTSNAKAHAAAKVSACCSAPPPGANQERGSKK